MKFTWFRKSIKNKIFFTYSSLLIIVVTLSTVIWYGTAASMLKRNINDSLTYSMETSVNSADLLLSDLDDILTGLILLDGVDRILRKTHLPPHYEWFLDYKEILSHLNLIRNYRSEISGIALIDSMGDLYESGHIYVSSGVKADLRSPWIANIRRNRGNVTFQRREDPLGHRTLSAGRAILTSEGIVGYAVIEVDYDQIEQIFQISANDDWTLNVQDDNGRIIFSSNYAVSKDYSQAESHDYVTVRETSGSYGWTLGILIPEKVFFKEIRSLRNRTAGFVFAVVLLILLSSQMIAKGITANIITLDKAMKRVRDGELTAAARIDSVDEIGMMNRSFQKMMERLRLLMDEIREREIKKKESEIEILQMQINPHFIYNTLNTINFLAIRNGQNEISEITVSFIELLHGSMSSRDMMVPLSRELEYIDSYVNIQKHKFRDEFDFVRKIDRDLLETGILKMLLQPIVENALIHGILPLERKGILELAVFEEEGRMIIQISDDGAGLSDGMREKMMNNGHNGEYQRFSGIGLSNTEERIKLYYGEDYGLTLTGNNPQGTVVRLILPLPGDEKHV